MTFLQSSFFQSAARAIPACALTLALVGCGGGGNTDAGPGPTMPTPTNALSLAVTPTVSIAQGGSAQIAATVARTVITNDVTLTVAGAPVGVTASITQPTGSGVVMAGSITLSTASSTAAGTYTLTVTAASAGATPVTATIALTVTAAGSYTLVTGGATATLGPSGTVLQTISITRNNFSAPITFAATGLPTGVTATFTPNPVSFDATVLALTAASNAPLATSVVTVRSSSPGFADKTITLAVTVAALGGFSISASPAAPTIAQGASGVVTVNLARTAPFTSFVLVTAEGAPTGLTAALASSSISGSSTTVTFTVSATLAVGTYPVVVRATSPGIPDATVTIPVAVTTAVSGATGNVVLDFSACVGFDVPVWVAWQDGNGAWTRITGTNNVYRFTVTGSLGSFAYVTQGATTNTASVNVQNATRNELSATPYTYCLNTFNSKIANGTVTGISGNDNVYIYMGGGLAFANVANPSFALSGIAGGTQDLIAWRHDPVADVVGGNSNDRGLVRRDQNVTTGASLGTLDMNGSESFTAASALFTVSGLAAGEEVSETMRYNSTAACIGATLYSSSRTLSANTFTLYGFPAALQRTNDYHQLIFGATTRQSGISYPVAQRTLVTTFRAIDARTIVLGVALPVPAVTTLTGTIKRVQAVFPLAAEYNTGATLSYVAVSKTVNISATAAWVAGTTATLSLPNFTGVTGWNDVYAPAAAANVQWTTTVSGTTLSGNSLCTEGARIVTAQRSGTI